MRSWDSETKISQGRMPEYFRGTFSSSTWAPPAMGASSPMEDARPPAPLSVVLRIRPCAQASSMKSARSFWVMGLPICTAVFGECLSISAEENVAPWIPSLPTRPPPMTMRSPGRTSFTEASRPASSTGITEPVPQ